MVLYLLSPHCVICAFGIYARIASCHLAVRETKGMNGPTFLFLVQFIFVFNSSLSIASIFFLTADPNSPGILWPIFCLVEILCMHYLLLTMVMQAIFSAKFRGK